MHLKGTTAIVTGAAQGLGRGFMEVLLDNGCLVYFSDIQEAKGKEVEQELQAKYGKDKALFIVCDVRSEEQLSKMYDAAITKFGHIDMVVNNAGILDESRQSMVVDINVMSVIRSTDMAIKHMRKDKGGRGGTIINIASMAGLVPAYFFPTYSATKHAVIGYTSSWAENPHVKSELGIQLACMAPSFVDTAILNQTDTHKWLYHDELVQIMSKVGVDTIDNVKKAFFMLLQDTNCNGDIIVVHPQQGIKYEKKNGKKSGVPDMKDKKKLT